VDWASLCFGFLRHCIPKLPEDLSLQSLFLVTSLPAYHIFVVSPQWLRHFGHFSRSFYLLTLWICFTQKSFSCAAWCYCWWTGTAAWPNELTNQQARRIAIPPGGTNYCIITNNFWKRQPTKCRLNSILNSFWCRVINRQWWTVPHTINSFCKNLLEVAHIITTVKG